MKRQRVYLDTSVIRGCFDDEFAPWSNGLVRDFREAHFTPIVSDLVAAEIAPAPQQADLLVSWNFRHIVRYDKIRMFSAVSREMGYKEIGIYSPREVTRYEEK